MNYAYSDSKLKLLINTYQYLTHKLDREPVKITTYVEAPPGSGLGSSSALVALVAAITEYYGIPMGEYDMFEDALEEKERYAICLVVNKINLLLHLVGLILWSF